jgi:hypothetical protein
MPVAAPIVLSLAMIVFCLSAARLRPRAPEAQSGRRAGLDIAESNSAAESPSECAPSRDARQSSGS